MVIEGMEIAAMPAAEMCGKGDEFVFSQRIMKQCSVACLRWSHGGNIVRLL